MPSPIETSFAKSLFFGAILEPALFPFRRGRLPEDLVPTLETWRRSLERLLPVGEPERPSRIETTLWEALGSIGALGISVPTTHGGGGWTVSAQARAYQELVSIDTAIGCAALAHGALACHALATFGSSTAMEEHLPSLASGKKTAAFALAEPTAGSDPAGLQTHAEKRNNNSYVINGTKGWTVLGEQSDVCIVFARTAPADDGHKPRISGFVVPKGPGVTATPTSPKLGVRGLPTSLLQLTQVAVPESALLGEAGKGFLVATDVLARARLSLAAGCIGLSKRIVRATLERASGRRAFGRSIGEFGLIRNLLSRMLSDTFALESTVYLSTGAVDAGLRDYAVESAICKILGAETVLRVAHLSMQVAAGLGYSTEAPFERALRDARFFSLFGGTNETLRCFVALSGMQGPAKEIAEVGKAIREPIKGFGLLSDFALRRARTVLGRDRMALHHPLLSREAAVLEDNVALLARNVDKVLRQHGQEIAEMQFTQHRIANAAIDLYAIAAVISRTSHALHERGGDGARRELDLTSVFVSDASSRLARTMAAFDRNDDELRKSIAARALSDGAYPLDIA